MIDEEDLVRGYIHLELREGPITFPAGDRDPDGMRKKLAALSTANSSYAGERPAATTAEDHRPRTSLLDGEADAEGSDQGVE